MAREEGRERERERERGERDRQTDRDRDRERQRQTDRQTDRQRQRQKERDRDRQRQRERQSERQRDTETERERERDRQRQRQRDRETERGRDGQVMMIAVSLIISDSATPLTPSHCNNVQCVGGSEPGAAHLAAGGTQRESGVHSVFPQTQLPLQPGPAAAAHSTFCAIAWGCAQYQHHHCAGLPCRGGLPSFEI